MCTNFAYFLHDTCTDTKTCSIIASLNRDKMDHFTSEQLDSIKRVLEQALVIGDEKGKEISSAYECGIYIGTIKSVISHIDFLKIIDHE